MVYSSVVDGYVKGIMVSCSCGCRTLEVKVLDDEAFISVFDSSFYAYQGLSIVKNGLRHVAKKVVKKQSPLLCDLFMTRDEVVKFIKLGKELEFDSDFVKDDGEPSCKNDSTLALDYVWDHDWPVSCDNYCLQVRSTMSNVDLLRGKGYRGYEICLKKDDWYALMDKMERYVAYVDTHYANRDND